ncbi:unnamed protein product [Malus baccata var. baccata]
MAIEDQSKNAAREEMREPLVRAVKAADGDGSGHGSAKGDQWMVYLSTFVAVCGSYEFGCGVGYSSPTQSGIMKDLGLSLAEYSMFGSILTFGAMIGAITIGPITDFLGRKGALRMSCVFCVAGWLAIYFSKGAVSLDVGRVATGYGSGAFSYIVPVFVAEIAPKNLRGRLTAVNQLMIVSGVSVSFIIGVVVHWRALALIGIVPCAVIIFGLFFIPESPRWLAKTGRQKEFELALQKLRGKDADISDEAAEIQVHELVLDAAPIFAVAGILIFIGSFSIGMGAVPWVIMSEIFPINIKGQAGSLTTLVNWVGAWLCSYTFNFLMSWNSYGTFILYAVVNVLAVLFVIAVVPETKGKTLEQIQGEINN